MLHQTEVMLKICCIFLLFLLFVPAAFAVKSFKAKKGWNFAPCPSLGYTSDLGFQYGAFCEIFNYGNGKAYPDYRHKFSIEASQFTKGSGVFRFFYDSEYFIPGIRLTADVSYLPEKMSDFYGFNGYESPYLPHMNNSFYKINRNQVRVTADLQGKLRGSWSWAAGISYFNYRIGRVSLKKYRDAPNLYDLYVKDGLINRNEAKGGNILQLKTGIVYDSRDREADPTRGIWGEAIVCASPDIIDRKGYNFAKLSAVFRHYVPLSTDKLTLAYRIGYQGTIAGRAPFYSLSNINTLYMRQTYSEGLGGTTTLRGILRNRIIGNGVVWQNLELRFRFWEFSLFRQNWYFVLNPFFDAGMVVQPYRQNRIRQNPLPEIYDGAGESLHMSAGIGAKVIMNHNFVLSVEMGKAFNEQDGNYGLGLVLNYLF